MTHFSLGGARHYYAWNRTTRELVWSKYPTLRDAWIRTHDGFTAVTADTARTLCATSITEYDGTDTAKTVIYDTDPILHDYLTSDSADPFTITYKQAMQGEYDYAQLRALAFDVWVLDDEHGEELIEDLIDLDIQYNIARHYGPDDPILTIQPQIRDYAQAA